MENLLLTNGQPILPNKLRLEEGINIGFVGAGAIAIEHAKVVISFNHNISCLVTKTISARSKKFIENYNIKRHYTNLDLAIKENQNIDAWIVCASWNAGSFILESLIKSNKPLLIEKSIFLTIEEINNFINSFGKSNVDKVNIGYNRNYYDFIPVVENYWKSSPPNLVFALLSDTFTRIINKHGKLIKPHLIKYVSSHWLSLIYKIFNNLDYKIELESVFKNKIENILSPKTIVFSAFSKKHITKLVISLIPDCPKNISIKSYSKDIYLELSPIETLKIFNDIECVTDENSQRRYEPKLDKKIIVDNSFKAGFRAQYYEFINACLLKKYQPVYSTTLYDLINIYKLCKYFE